MIVERASFVVSLIWRLRTQNVCLMSHFCAINVDEGCLEEGAH